MCRFLAYRGNPIFLDRLVSSPEHSLVRQSIHAEQAKTETNGDGFGIGWYAHHPHPGVYREVHPAWSDENLRSICSQVTSRLFFAHVRAATGTSTSRSNCHPFSHGKWMFMHNGQIGGWHTIRRDVEALITNETYASRLGTTDSEAIFLAALSRGLDANPIGAMTETIRDICTIQTRHNITTPLRFTAAMTDGVDMFAFRWSSDEAPPTLYWQATDHGMIVVSEPLDHEHGHWTEVPKNSAFSAVGSKVACSDFSPQGSP
jgi:glutamine amidotransferase